MRYTKFDIRNFKGIEAATIDLSSLPNANVFTLVGLNESGKTTVLEAINAFSTTSDGTASLYEDVIQKFKEGDLVPKARKGNFTGTIRIIAHVLVEPSDIKKIEKFCGEKLSLSIDISKIPTTLEIARTFHFENSNHTKTTSVWDFYPHLKQAKQKNFRKYEADTGEWQKIIAYVRTLLPTVCYFPTFLFNFPERIYLSNPPEQSTVNDYYVQIVQDILDSLDDDLNIATHIVDRIEKTVEPDTAWNLYGFLKSDAAEQIAHVMLMIGNEVTRVIFNRWNEVFGVKIQDKVIDVEWHVEEAERDTSKRAVYLKFKIRDRKSRYDIAERSLGFRWFFSFLLFTQFRASRRDSAAIFLFDEPASNLHSRAQEQLLKSFPNISKGNNMIIYSTHSHYMIEPRWLEGTYIVFNDAIDYDDGPADEGERKISTTNIHMQKYRDFVGQYPMKMSYYQPILDKLQYTPSKLEFHSPNVLFEGKNDFYFFEYFRRQNFSDQNLSFMPSGGADDLGTLISLFLGWGKPFIGLLDDDDQGRAAKKRYTQEWFLDDGDVITIGDVDEKFLGWKCENLIADADRQKLRESIGGNGKLSKKEIARFFQEKCARDEAFLFTDETINNVGTVIKKLSDHFSIR